MLFELTMQRNLFSKKLNIFNFQKNFIQFDCSLDYSDNDDFLPNNPGQTLSEITIKFNGVCFQEGALDAFRNDEEMQWSAFSKKYPAQNGAKHGFNKICHPSITLSTFENTYFLPSYKKSQHFTNSTLRK